MVLVVDRVWCRSCTERRQESIARSLPIGLPTPVRIIIEDIEAPILQCVCGGSAVSFRHEESLLHRTWAWSAKETS